MTLQELTPTFHKAIRLLFEQDTCLEGWRSSMTTLADGLSAQRIELVRYSAEQLGQVVSMWSRTTQDAAWKPFAADDRHLEQPVTQAQCGQWSSGNYWLAYPIIVDVDRWMMYLERPGQAWTAIEQSLMSTYAAAFEGILSKVDMYDDLMRKEHFLTSIINELPTHIVVKDREGTIRLANKSFCAMAGIRSDDIIGLKDEDFIDDLDLVQRFKEENAYVFNTGQRQQYHFRQLPGHDNSPHYAVVDKIPIQLHGDTPTHVVVLMNNLTQQYLSEAKVIEEHRLLTSVTETIPGSIFLFDINRHQIIFNNLGEELLGFKVHDIDDLHVFYRSRLHPDDVESATVTFYERLSNVAKGQAMTCTYRMLHRDGTYRWMIEHTKLFQSDDKGNPVQYLSLIQDVTTQEQNRNTLAKQQNQLELIFSSSSMGISHWSLKTLRGSIDTPFLKMMGYEADELGDSIMDYVNLLHPDDVYGLSAKCQSLITGEEHFVEAEYRFATKMGDYRWILTRGGVTEYDANGHPIASSGIHIDITQLKEAELALKKSETFFKSLFDNSPLGNIICRPDGTNDLFNDQFAKMLGYSREELIDVDCLSEDIFGMTDFYELVAAGQKLDNGGYLQFQKELTRKDGSILHTQIYATMITNEAGEVERVMFAISDETKKLRAKKKLAESEALYRNLFEHNPLGTCLKGADGVIRSTNKKFQKLLGYSDKELIGTQVFDLCHPDVRDNEVWRYKEAYANTQSIIKRDKRFKRKNGSAFVGAVRTAIIYNQDGQPEFSLDLVEDVTESRAMSLKLENSEILKSAILQAFPDVTSRIAADGRILDVISSADKLSYYSDILPKDPRGTKVQDYMPPEVIKKFESCLSRSFSGMSSVSMEFETLIQGTVHYIEMRFEAINEAEAVVIVRDQTKGKRAENLLKQNYEQLNKKNKELQAYIDSNAQLEQFAYLVSHDLQEPLRGMRSFAGLLQEDYAEGLDDKGNKYLNLIISSGERMGSMIDDLLQYSRIGGKPKDKQVIKTRKLFQSVLLQQAMVIGETGATIHIEDVPENIFGSVTRLRQLFGNLISNAIKFGQEGVPPQVWIGGREVDGEKWQFYLRDNGIGIAAHYQRTIFEIFKRLHNQHKNGNGLGLAICKKVVEQHNGNIWVESVPGEGSTFYIELAIPEEATLLASAAQNGQHN